MSAKHRNDGLFAYFVRSYRVTFLIIIGLALFGIFTAINLPRESTPEIDIPIAIITTIYPGSSAQDVEELVTKPLEDAVKNEEGVDKVTSSSQAGISNITVEFEVDADKDKVVRGLQDAVDAVQDLPLDAEDPHVSEINFSSQPILTIGLSGLEDRQLLSAYANDLADELETIAGVSAVRVVGSQEKQVRVEVDPTVIQEKGISIGQILSALQQFNVNIPAGAIETGDLSYDLRINAQFQDIGDIATLPIPTAQGTTVPLSDIASVQLALSDLASTSKISTSGNASTPSVSLQVQKKSGGNIINIVDEVTKRTNEIAKEQFPPEIQVTTFADQADEIRTSLRNVTTNGFETFLIVFIILWLFLGWKEAAIASTAVPFTFFMSFILFDMFDVTLNSISLFSLILALGLLVDTAIVIVEGIHARRNEGSAEEAAINVIKEFQKPLAAGVLTTVAAFFPMLLVSGIIGEFLRTIPIVLSATLLSSLVVALALLPAVAAQILHRWPNQVETRFSKKFRYIENWYGNFINHAVRNRRFQNLFILTLVALMIVGFALPFSGLVKTGLFPNADVDFIIGNVELPTGSRLERTEDIMAQVETTLREVPEIKSFTISSGAGVSIDIGGAPSSEHIGSFFINLDKERKESSLDIAADLRKKFATITGAKIEVLDVSAGPPTAAPVEVTVKGPQINELNTIAQQLMADIDAIPGTVEIDNNLTYNAGEFVFTFRRDELAKAGFSPQEVGQTLRLALFGIDATSFLNDENEETTVRLTATDSSVSSIDRILALQMTSRQGTTVPLAQLVNVNLEPSLNVILHRDSDRAVTVTAKVEEGVNANQVSSQLSKKIETYHLPRGYEITVGGEQQETADTFKDLYKSMVIAIIAIAGILVIEFNSYRQPFIIILSIPLALIGVFFGLLILRGELNFAAFIGLVSLTGIVVNNAILLVDQMNNINARHDRTAEDAAVEASSSRLRPIILTTLTTAGGVGPLVFVDAFFRDLSLTLMTGLLFSTILTLVLVPILYVRQQQKFLRKQQKSSGI